MSGLPAPVTDEARAVAEDAARRSGVRVRPLREVPELHEVERLFQAIWRPAPGGAPASVELMRALARAGGYLAGAYAGDRLVGACIGFLAAPPGVALHSHVAGVAPDVQRRSVGRAVKLHQRAWALERGLTRITWTFDPLVRRNAWFNLGRLAATPVEYLPDFYGPMADAINAADPTDRLFTTWELTADPVVAAVAGRPPVVDLAALRGAGAVAVVEADDSGAPALRDADPERPALVAVPPDIEALRLGDPELAATWRLAVRTALGGGLAAGGRVTGFAREGWYVLEPPPGS